MVILRLAGGLGNQLFQIATALSIVGMKPEKILVDKSEFISDLQHGGYRLDKLCLPKFGEYKLHFGEKFLVRLLNKMPVITKFIPYYCHEKFYKSADIDCGYLIGYWQGSENFNDIFYDVKGFFVPNYLSEQAFNYSGAIKSTNSVSVHVRRGDYTDKSVQKNHGVCSFEYYRDAILEIRKRVDNPHFFIFTNDDDWVSLNLGDLFFDLDVTYVKGNDQETDLWLMSLCEHSIIANSSFSWWGAYLGRNTNQIVISPTPWYERAQRSSFDPSLPNWIRIKK